MLDLVYMYMCKVNMLSMLSMLSSKIINTTLLNIFHFGNIYTDR